MSKQHFIALARRIAEIADWHAKQQAAKAVADVAIVFNSRFDRSRFYIACGLDSTASLEG